MNNSAAEPGVAALPWWLAHTTAFKTNHDGEMIFCNTCITNCTDLQGSDSKLSQNRGLPLLKSSTGHSLSLRYQSEDEDHIVKKIIAMGSSEDRPPTAAAFLLCLCVQYSSACLHASDLRRLLLLIASGVQSAVWVSSGKKNDI